MGRALENVAVLVAYFATAVLGLHFFEPVSGSATLVWAPSGLALAALVLRGRALWPGVALGALAANAVATDAPLLTDVAIAFGNTAEAVLGAWLLERFVGFRPSLERLRDVVGLVLLAAVLSTAVSATVGVASTRLGRGPIDLATTWRVWWLGDAIGDLVVAPLVFVLGVRPRFTRPLEAALALVSLVLVSGVIFGDLAGAPARPSAYLIFPLLVWAAVRFGPAGGAAANLITCVVAIAAAKLGRGPFAGGTLTQNLVGTQLFMSVVALSVLVLSAAIAERARALAERDHANRELEARNEELARSNRELEDFASVASHELQEPLRKIQIYGGRLRGAVDTTNRDDLDRVLRSSSRMQELVDDILTLARVPLSDEPFVPTDLGEVVREVLADLEATIAGERAKVVVGPLPTIEADPGQMRQLLGNLVSNAVKFHRPAIPATVEITATEDKGSVTLLVKDDGIGFDEAYVLRIFQAFRRLHGRDEFSGTGLGLAICRRIVERHGGSMSANSSPGQGATFAVTMPKSRST